MVGGPGPGTSLKKLNQTEPRFMTEELDQNQCIQWAKFFQEGQRRNFAYLFPVADDAVQIDVTTLCPFLCLC